MTAGIQRASRRLAVSGLVLPISVAIAVSPEPAAAEPYLAVRSGMKCAMCHVNVTGAGKRTEFGLIYAQTVLPHVIKQAAGEPTLFDPKLSKNVSIGGDFRLALEAALRKNAENSNGFTINEGNLYLQVDVIPDFLTFYLDQQVAPSGASSREAVGMIRAPTHNFTFKAGRFLLPYGLRIWDDDAFIRRVTGFNFDSQDLGVEATWQPGRWDASVAVSNGTQGAEEVDRNKQVSAVTSIVFTKFRGGASFAHNESDDVRRTMGGVFAGFTAGRFVFLGEFDVLDSQDKSEGAQDFGHQLIAYVEGNVLLTKGINAKVAYDWWDPYRDVSEDEQIMFRAGLEAFLTQFLRVGALFRYREAPPQLALDNEDEVFVELHVFF